MIKMFDMVEIRNRDGGKVNVPLETNRVPHEDFGEMYGIITIGREPYVLVADMTDDPRKGDIEGRKWRIVHPKSVRFPDEFFERENSDLVIHMIAPHIGEEKLNKIRKILKEE